MMTAQTSHGDGAPTHDERRYEGLLTQLMTNTLDADYEVVARQQAQGAKHGRHHGGGLLTVAAIFGIMLGASAIRTDQTRPEADAERAELVSQIHDRQDRLDDTHRELTDLQSQVAALQTDLASDVTSDRTLANQLATLGVAAGTVAVSGPGLVITTDNADSSQGAGGTILDTDLQALVNALWESGAEAIAIDGHRLTSLTSIRFAGQAITVDYRSLSPPYVITVIGDTDTMPARLLQTPGVQTWLGLQANFGITFETEVKDNITVPADPHDHLLYAEESGGGAS
jgi:uncharacterized protein YlxW (UPF0749 family)